MLTDPGALTCALNNYVLIDTLHTTQENPMPLAWRIGNVQPFVDLVEREDDRYGGVQLGVVTYNDDDSTYKVSYTEFGGRFDHAYEPLMRACGQEVSSLSTDSPLESDTRLMREPTESPKKDSNVTDIKAVA